MTLAVERIVDHRPQSDTGASPPYHPAATNYVFFVSPNDRYIGGAYYTDPTLWVADTETSEVVQNYNVGSLLTLGDLPLFVEGTDKAIFVDNSGSMWTSGQSAGGEIYEFPLGQLDKPVLRFTCAGSDGFDLWAFGQKFELSDGSFLVVLIAALTSGSLYPQDYHTWDGTTYTNGTLTWVPQQAFQDDNSDVWLCGVVRSSSITSCHFTRITDVTGASPYPATQTFTGLPDLSVNTTGLWGTFVNGYFVGGWIASALRDSEGAVPSRECDYLIRLKLDGSGSVTTSNISGSAPTGYKWGLPNRYIPTNSTFISLEVIDPGVASQRKYGFFDTATLANTANYALADWNAGDDTVAETSGASVALNYDAVGETYLYTKQAFMAQAKGVGYFEPDNPDEPLQNVGKVFLYLLVSNPDGDGDGTSSSSLTIRSWGFSLDGHDFYVLRLGPSGTFVYDLTTGAWSEWVSPGRTNWRPHVGQNWKGLTNVNTDNGDTEVVCGDDATGTLWRLNVTKGRDERSNQPGVDDKITKVVTGGIQVTGRDTVACGALELDLSLGNPTQTGASITLEMSDDSAHTWVNCGSVTVASGDRITPVEWRSLGTASSPGRVFRITDDGLPERIGGATLR